MALKTKIAILLLGASVALFAQPATTTVADTLYMAIGGPTYCSGTFTLTWSTFYSADGYLIQGGTSAPIPVNTSGQFSVNVVPTNTTITPATGIYNIRYNLQPSGCAPASEYWNVPSSSMSVNLNMVRTLPTPPPSLIPVTSLYPPLTGSQVPLCYTGGVVQWTTSCEGSGTVTSVGLTMPGIFSVSGSPIIGSGTLAVSLGTQSANKVWAGPASGSAAIPTFRSLVLADLPALTGSSTSILYGNGSGGFSNVTVGSGLSFSGGTLSASGGSGTVTSVGLSLPNIFTVSNSPVTTSGTLTAVLASQTANYFWAAPNGSNGTPAFRAIVGADLPTPTSSTLGGVESLASVAHKWINQISTAGAPSATQPACGDLSDSSGGCSMSTTAGGDLSGTLPSPTVAKVNGGSVPASAKVAGTNSSNQIVAATQSNVNAIGYAAGGGTANAQTVTLSPAISSYAAGLTVSWIPSNANTSSTPTLNVNSVGTATIVKVGGAALAASDLTTTAVATAIYDGTYFELQNPQTVTASGVTFQQVYGDAFTAPATSNFGSSYVSSGTTGVSFSNTTSSGFTAVTLTGTATSNDTNLIVKAKNVASTPYSYRMRFWQDGFANAYGFSGGLCLTDGTNFIMFGMFTRGQSASNNNAQELRVAYFTSTTSFNTSPFEWPWYGVPGRAGLVDLKIYDDGTNRHYRVIGDGVAADEVEVYVESDTANSVTPTQVGPCIAPGHNATQSGNSPTEFITVVDFTAGSS